MKAWLTPDAADLLETLDTRTIRVPGSLWLYVSGTLSLLCDSENWEQDGDATPEQMAQFFVDVVDEYLTS
jgi:hypothetical protein